MQARREWREIFKVLRGVYNIHVKFCTLWNYPSLRNIKKTCIGQYNCLFLLRIKKIVLRILAEKMLTILKVVRKI